MSASCVLASWVAVQAPLAGASGVRECLPDDRIHLLWVTAPGSFAWIGSMA
jgi:hypothetical protein